MFVFHGIIANYFGYLELFQQKSTNSLEIIPRWCNCGCNSVARKLFEVPELTVRQHAKNYLKASEVLVKSQNSENYLAKII